MLAENSDKNLTSETGEVRRDHSHLGNRPAGADQRHSGSQQDRIRQDGRGSGRRPLQRAAKTTARARSGTWPTARVWTSRSSWARTLPPEIIHTDAKRLQQVLKNLLSNALKFTEQGSVQLTIDKAASGWSPSHTMLSRAKAVIAFSVTDTGIGIHAGKAAHHLRSVPAGRRNHQPQVRRHGPGTFHQPRTGAAAGRRNPAAERARRGQHVHAVSAANLRDARRAAQERGAAHHAAGAAGAGGESDGRRRRRHDSACRPRWPPKSWWRTW